MRWVGGKVYPGASAAGGVESVTAAAWRQVLVGGDRWRLGRARSEARVSGGREVEQLDNYSSQQQSNKMLHFTRHHIKAKVALLLTKTCALFLYKMTVSPRKPWRFPIVEGWLRRSMIINGDRSYFLICWRCRHVMES